MHIYDINRHKSTHGNKCSKYKKFLRMMILIHIRQDLSKRVEKKSFL